MSRSKQPNDTALKANGKRIGRWRDQVLSEHGPKDPSAKLVALAVAKFINAQSMQTFAGVDALSKATGLNERTVRRHITDLLAAGWLGAEPIPGKGWIKRRFLMLSTPHASAGNTPCDRLSGSTDSAGIAPGDVPAGPAGNAPGDIAGNTSGDIAGNTSGEQRASGPTSSGHLAPLQRALCPVNSVNTLNTGEHDAQARRLKMPAQGAKKALSKTELRDKVTSLHQAGQGAEQIVHTLQQYQGVTQAAVEDAIAADRCVMVAAASGAA